MWKNYLFSSIRGLINHKFYTLCNLLGLVGGYSAFLFLIQYVAFEKSYENFIPNRDNIVRVTLDKYRGNELIVSGAESYVGMGPVFLEELPEVVAYTRTFNASTRRNSVISSEENASAALALKVKNYYYADSAFLNFFGHELTQGDPTTALALPGQVVISRSLAKMFFGDDDPMGKTLRLRNEKLNDDLHVVTGVFRDLPSNTHLRFDMLLSYKTLASRRKQENYFSSWHSRRSYTYLALAPGVDRAALAEKLPEILSQHKDIPEGKKEAIHLQPLSEIHLNPKDSDEPGKQGDGEIVRFMGIVALVIILLAWANYINLSTSRVLARSVEVGVRKVLGAMRPQLIAQFMVDCLVINFVSILISLLVLILMWNKLNALAELTIPIDNLLQGWFGLSLLGILILSVLLSGLYPSLLLSSFHPIRALTGKIGATPLKWQKQFPVVFQFFISFALITSTIFFHRQLEFMKTQDLGLNIDQTLVIELPGVLPSTDMEVLENTFESYRNQIVEHPAVYNVCSSLTIPGHTKAYRTSVRAQHMAEGSNVTLRFNSADFNFIPTFGMEIIAGRNFSPLFPNDPDSAIVVTESAAAKLGFENPEEIVGEIVELPVFKEKYEVVGVIGDYKQESFKTEMEPMVITCTSWGSNFYAVKMQSDQYQNVISHIETIWTQSFPGNPLEYFFLDDYFNRQYQNEQRFARLFGTFALLAVIVGCIGLIGLSSYSVHLRTKEIGIRKALGSSVSKVFFMITRDFVKLVLIAIIFSVPITYFLIRQWLNDFAYQAPLSLWTFLVAACLILLVAFLSVTYQVLNAALVNPIKSLRYE